MSALILYDSISLASNANALLQRASLNADGTPTWHVRLWRTQMLKEPRFFELAQNDAAEAQLIICAWHESRLFSQWIQDWLDLWVLGGNCRQPAIALLGESDQILFSHTAIKLREFSESRGIAMITSQPELPCVPATRSNPFPPSRARCLNMPCAAGAHERR